MRSGFMPQALERECGSIDLFESFAGRGFLVNFFQIKRNDTGINLGGGDLAVSQHFLHMPDRGPAPQHFRGAGMAQAVGGSVPGQARLLSVLPDHVVQHLRMKRTTALAEEEASPASERLEVRKNGPLQPLSYARAATSSPVIPGKS